MNPAKQEDNSIRKSVDALLSAKTSEEKPALFQQLARSGHLDEAIADLKQRAADDPNNPGLPTTLGEVQLNKLRAIRDAAATPMISASWRCRPIRVSVRR